jgi:hypothetical protein
MAGKIFINYRRGDDPGFAQALLGRLERAFSTEQLFIDVDNIEPGMDFVRVLEEQISKCDVVLAVIGKGWVDALDERNARRLDNPEDWVRIEISSALNQDKRVIPVLVGDALMPRSDQLPDALKPLATRNAVRLRHDRFRADADGLVKALQKVLEDAENQRRMKEVEAQNAQAEEDRRLERDADAFRKSQEATIAREAEDRWRAVQIARLAREPEAKRITEQERRDAAGDGRSRQVEPQQKGEAERTKEALVWSGSIIVVLIFVAWLALAPRGLPTNAGPDNARSSENFTPPSDPQPQASSNTAGPDKAQSSGNVTASGRPILNFNQDRPPPAPLPQDPSNTAAPDNARPSGKFTSTGRPILTFER